MARRSGIQRLIPHRAFGRLAVAAVVGVLVACLALQRFNGTVALLAGWNAGGLSLLAFAWILITGCDARVTHEHAAAEDPGRKLIYVIVTATSMVSLFAATVLSSRVKQHMDTSHMGPSEARVVMALCLGTVALAWALTHTSFTLRYAHLYYYREDDAGVGGAEFPGGARPDYADFAYLAFTVGMCFQVSDVTISSASLRRAVLLHAVISFGYNTAILAFVLNLVFGGSG